MIPTDTQIMIDLETMGTGPKAAIVSIGAVAFRFDTGEIDPRTFYATIRLDSAVRHGGEIDPGTVVWWLRKGGPALGELLASGQEIGAVLSALRGWWADVAWPNPAAPRPPVPVWSNGATFDLPILEGAMQRMGFGPLWSHKEERCYRTLRALDPECPWEPPTIPHHALGDARAQAWHAIAIVRRLHAAGVAVPAAGG